MPTPPSISAVVASVCAGCNSSCADSEGLVVQCVAPEVRHPELLGRLQPMVSSAATATGVPPPDAFAPLHAPVRGVLGPALPHWLVLLAAAFGVWALVRVGVGVADALFDRFEN